MATYTITSGGLERLYIVDLPTPQVANMPLLFVFHAGGGNAAGFRNVQHWETYAAPLGIVTVYGEVYQPGGGNWNSDPMPGVGWVTDTDISDDLYIDDVLADLAARGISIDPTRIYGTGYSSGGYMCYHLARDRADLFTAHIILASSLADITGTPAKPVAIWHWHGSADTIIPWEGAAVVPPPLDGMEQFAIWNGEAVPNFVDVGGGTLEAALSTGWPIRYNLVPGATHTNTGNTMNRPTVLNWLLQFSRDAAEHVLTADNLVAAQAVLATPTLVGEHIIYQPTVLKLRVVGETTEYNIVAHPASGILQSDIPPVLRLTPPIISGTGVVGTNHNYTAGTNDAGLPSTAVWALDGTPTGVQATPGIPYVPAASANGKRLSVIETVPYFPELTVASLEIIIVSDPGALTFPALLTQAQLDTVIIEEIPEGDPDAGTSGGGRRRGWFSGLPVTAGFTWLWSSTPTEGGTTGGTVFTPSDTMPIIRQDSQPKDTTIYNILQLRRDSDLAVNNQMPSSGHTGGTVPQQITLIPTVGNPARGQAPMVIEGFAGTVPLGWPTVSTAIVDAAVAAATARYDVKGGAGSNMQEIGDTCLIPVYAEFKGDLRTSVTNKVTEQMNAFLDGSLEGDMPYIAQGPASAREITALAFFHILRKCARWASLSSTTKTKIDALFYCLGFGSCWMVNDGSVSGGALGLRGHDSDVKGVAPNISCGPPFIVLLAGAWFGYQVFDDWLNTATIATVRTLASTNFGTSSNLYKTLNWANEGISQSASDAYYRANASTTAPSDTEVNNSVGRLIYYTNGKLNNPETILLPNNERGMNKAIPAQMSSSASNPYIGLVQHTSLNGAGLMVNGTLRGYVYTNKTATPHLGDDDCMVFELSATDGEGLRMSLPYAMWTICCVNSMFIGLLMADNFNFASSTMIALMHRWKKANEVVKHFQTNDFNSIAHASAEANGGAGQSARWSDYAADLMVPQQMFIWDAVLAKSGAV